MGAVTRGRRRSSQRDAINDVAEQDEEETKTVTRRGRRSEPVHQDDEDEDERPARRRSKVKESSGRKSGRVAKSGWGSVDEAKEKAPAGGGEFGKDLELPEKEEILIKFGEAEPYDVYLQHWVERGKGKKKSFTCAEDECPLDEVGDKPSVKVCFNVISLADPDEPVLRRWIVGPQVADIIKDYAEDKKYSPIDREDLYFAVKRFQKDKRWTTTVTPVKARDLDEDWDTEPLSEDEIADLMKDAYDYTSTEDTPMKVLEEVADEIAEG